jgi:hypothetical protein
MYSHAVRGLGHQLRNIDMKKLFLIINTISLIFLQFSTASAQAKHIEELTVVVPAESIAKFIQPLLPYRIDIGKNFSGSFWVKSIENLKINKDRISFSAHIYGEDIGYSAKIGKQTANFKVGQVNLRNHWEASLRFDKSQQELYIKPHIESLQNKKDFSQGDILLDTLFNALSDIEYPIDLTRIKPITTELYDTKLIINTRISDVYTDNNKLFVEIIPTAQKKSAAAQ